MTVASTATKKSAVRHKREYRGKTAMVTDNQKPQSEHPYCALPEGFFDHLSLRKKLEIDRIDSNERTLFSVRTWDGREVMKIESLT